MKNFTYLVRREVWEHRSLYVVPLIFLALTILSTLIGVMQGRDYIDLAWATRKVEQVPEHVGNVAGAAGMILWLLFWMLTTVVASFYLLDCLWGDRKDRSILFWKSLPLSDTSTVLSKLFTGIVVAPLISVGVSLVATFALLIMVSIGLALGGGNPMTLLWSQFPLITLVYKAISVSLLGAIWFLPFSGWLLFSSSASRRTPFLMAILIPIGIIFVEKLALDSSRFANAIARYFEFFFVSVFEGGGENIVTIDGENVSLPGDLADVGNIIGTLTEPMLLVGLAIGAAFIAGAIYMRRHRVDAG